MGTQRVPGRVFGRPLARRSMAIPPRPLRAPNTGRSPAIGRPGLVLQQRAAALLADRTSVAQHLAERARGRSDDQPDDELAGLGCGCASWAKPSVGPLQLSSRGLTQKGSLLMQPLDAPLEGAVRHRADTRQRTTHKPHTPHTRGLRTATSRQVGYSSGRFAAGGLRTATSRQVGYSSGRLAVRAHYSALEDQTLSAHHATQHRSR